MTTIGAHGVQSGPQRNGVNGTDGTDEKKGELPWDGESCPNLLANAKTYLWSVMMTGSKSSIRSESRTLAVEGFNFVFPLLAMHES